MTEEVPPGRTHACVQAESERDRLETMQQQRQLQVQQLSAGYHSISDSMRMVHDASKGMLLQQQG